MGVVNVLLLDDYTKYVDVRGVWFNCRGLDSLVSLQIIKVLRIVSRVYGQTVIAAQNQVLVLLIDRLTHTLQPSQDIFDLFDKVMVLNEGQCIYFGPTSQALEYFQGMCRLQHGLTHCSRAGLCVPSPPHCARLPCVHRSQDCGGHTCAVHQRPCAPW